MTREELIDWAETHHVIVEALTEENKFSEILRQKCGIGAMFELGIDMTNEFQDMHKNVEWGVEYDWFDTLEDFIYEKLKTLTEHD